MVGIELRVKVVQVGNSLRVAIPKDVAESLAIKAGDLLGLSLDDSRILLRKLTIEYSPNDRAELDIFDYVKGNRREAERQNLSEQAANWGLTVEEIRTLTERMERESKYQDIPDFGRLIGEVRSILRL